MPPNSVKIDFEHIFWFVYNIIVSNTKADISISRHGFGSIHIHVPLYAEASDNLIKRRFS
jgi:hypothetical protein